MVGVKENILSAEHEPALRRHIGEPIIFNQLITVGQRNKCVIFQYWTGRVDRCGSFMVCAI